MIKAVVFDFGGVLAEEGFWQGLRQIALQNGKDPDEFFRTAEDLIHRPGGYVIGMSDEQTYWNELRQSTGISGSDEELRGILLSKFLIRSEMLQLVAGLRSKGYLVAILSDQTNWLDELNQKSPFYHLFDFVFNSYAIHKSKRDSSVFRDICSSMGVETGEVLFIDDNVNNINRARGEGLMAIHFRDAVSLKTELRGFLAGTMPDEHRDEKIYDCIIIGAGPGGLQAAIYLGRFNRDVLLIDRGGGRTSHAKHIENFLGQKAVSGMELIALGMEQARHFNVVIIKGKVTKVLKTEHFEVYVGETLYRSKYVIVSTGGRENIPDIENIPKFFGRSFFTCMYCDGYRTTGKKLAIIGNSINTVLLAFAMRRMYTKDITLVLLSYDPPEDYIEELRAQGIQSVKGKPGRIIGDEKIEALEFSDGSRIECEVIMSNFGFKLNDDFLSELGLKKGLKGFKYVTDRHFESSLKGLFIVGPLTGHDQVVIAAGEGAIAAIAVNKGLLDL